MHPVIQILRDNGYPVINYGADYIRTVAKWRGGNDLNVSVGLRNGRATDWKVGENYSAEELVQLINGELEFDFSHVIITDVKEKIKLRKKLPIEILNELVPQYDLFLKRGISEEVLKEFQCGLRHSNPLRMRICFPIWDNHKLVGLSGRWYQEKTPKGQYKIPSWKHYCFRTSQVVFPDWLSGESIRATKTVILVEGISDILKLYTFGVRNCLCLFGLKISQELINYLCGLGVEKIIIATNNEPDNNNIGNEAAMVIKKRLLNFFNESSVEIKLPYKKDFCIMSDNEIHCYIKNNKIAVDKLSSS